MFRGTADNEIVKIVKRERERGRDLEFNEHEEFVNSLNFFIKWTFVGVIFLKNLNVFDDFAVLTSFKWKILKILFKFNEFNRNRLKN